MGVPVPGETILVVGAVTAAAGHLSPWGVALAGWAGAVIGDNLGYGAGRLWGPRLVRLPGVRHVFDDRRAAVAQRFFERRGWLAVFLGRFVAILRIFAGPLAGINHMPWRIFLIANATGAAIWVGVVVAVGVLLGSNLDRAVSLVGNLGYAGLGLAAGAVVLWYLWHRRRTRREQLEGERILAARSGHAAGEGEGSFPRR